jgi:hypothetical protein
MHLSDRRSIPSNSGSVGDPEGGRPRVDYLSGEGRTSPRHICRVVAFVPICAQRAWCVGCAGRVGPWLERQPRSQVAPASRRRQTQRHATGADDVHSGNGSCGGTCGDAIRIELRREALAVNVRRGRDYFAGEKEVGAKNELSIFATIGPAASLAFLTSTHSGSTTNLPHLTSRSARLSQTSM